MADTDKSTETETTTEPKTTAKVKAKAKPKAKAKAKAKAKPKVKAKAKAKPITKPTVKPETETTSKANTADAAPYQNKESKIESSPAQSPKKKSFTTLLLIAVFAILVITTIYKLNIELNDLSTQVDTQENTSNAEPGDLSAQVETQASTVDVVAAPVVVKPVAVTQEETANIEQDAAVVEAPKQETPPAYQAPREQSRSEAIAQANKQANKQAQKQAQARSAKHNETMLQRRQAFEKEMQLKKQEYEAIVEAHKQERAKLAAEQNDVMLRIKQKNADTKLKVDELRKQIYVLHQQINQIMRESSQAQRRP